MCGTTAYEWPGARVVFQEGTVIRGGNKLINNDNNYLTRPLE